MCVCVCVCVCHLPTTNTYRHNKVNKLLNYNFQRPNTKPLQKINRFVNEESTNIGKLKIISLISLPPPLSMIIMPCTFIFYI